MIVAPMPHDEPERLAALARYHLDGPGREPAFDHAVQLAAETFGVPISLISIVGADLQCFKGNHGLGADQTPRDIAFCSHAILRDEVLVVEDALDDARFADNPLVQGEPRIRFYAGAPLRLRDGQVPGTLCLIDHRPRRFPQRDQMMLRRLATVVVDLIEMRLGNLLAEERHRALERMKDEFLAATSHELRTPVTSIVGSLGLLGMLSDVLPENARRLVQIAQNNGERLSRLINDVLDLSRLSDGAITIEVVPVSATQALAECLEAHLGYAAKHDILLELGRTETGLSFEADADRLQQVLSNLVSNAVKFSSKPGPVRLSAERVAEKVRLSVTDTGRGIPEAFRDRIFERFVQIEATDATQKGGSGLGLAISRELVMQMGGTIDFESNAGKGTTFFVEFQQSPGSAVTS
ncbi:MAG: ATP-binding protein [Novosphingobium sp.]